MCETRSQVQIADVAEFLLTRSLFLIFLIAFYRAAFCRVHFTPSVCEVKLRLCVKKNIFKEEFRKRSIPMQNHKIHQILFQIGYFLKHCFHQRAIVELDILFQ